MKESVGRMSSRLTIRLLNLKRSQLNRVVQVLTGHCNLQQRKKIIGRSEFLCVQNLAWRKKHQIIMLAIASFTKIFV